MRVLFLAPFALFPVAAIAETASAILPQPPLAEHVAAFPRVAGDGAASQAINARLQTLDESVAELSDCELNRKVRVSLDSASYLSLYSSEDSACEGAAHPSFIEYGLTFDRATGAEVDWAKLLPETLLGAKDASYDPNYPFASAALNAAYLAGLDPKVATGECKEVYAMGMSFDFWLEAGKGLAMQPSDLPFAVMACAETVYLPVEALRGAGASSALITALESGTGAAQD